MVAAATSSPCASATKTETGRGASDTTKSTIARARHASRRLVVDARLVDLRGDRRRLAALEARRAGAREPHLQPLEHRPRPLLPPARLVAGRAARLLVGPDVLVARARARRDPR